MSLGDRIVGGMKPDSALGIAMMVVGAIAIPPAAMGVAQYTKQTADGSHTDEQHSIYAVQSTFLALAAVAFVLGVIFLGMGETGAKSALSSFRSRYL